MTKPYDLELARIERQNREQAEYIAQNEKFVAAFEELCKQHGRNFNAGANIIMFANLERNQRYTQAQLEAAFKWVQPHDNWKNPIDCRRYFTDAERAVVAEAVRYFTGGAATFVPVHKAGDKTCYRITAPGYYMSVGA